MELHAHDSRFNQILTHAQKVCREMQEHEKKLKKAEKYILEQIRECRERLATFFTKHQERRDAKKSMDRAFDKANTVRRKELIAEEHQYREKKHEAELQFLDERHKSDLDWRDQMVKYYEAQYQQWLDECAASLKLLEEVRSKLEYG